MNTCGIVAEYNPFHNGHLLHIKKAREISNSNNIVVVMSGNFVQRGEPALCDKYARTKMALLNGADIVIELPVYFATASAEYFAHSSINLLDKTGIIDYVCFGSELGDVAKLSEIADILNDESEDFQSALKMELKKGLSFPLARANAIKAVSDINTDFLNEPNDILAIEYLKALKALKSNITPLTIKRELSSHYHSKNLNKTISSATAIRDIILNNSISYAELKSALPETCLEILKNEFADKNAPNSLDNFTQIFQYILRNVSREDLKQILDINEGLENRFINFSSENDSISKIIRQVKTKRYAFTKLQRAVLHTILDIKEVDLQKHIVLDYPKYIRILGFRKEKSYLLKEIENKSGLPVVLNLKNANKILDTDGLEMLHHEIRTTDLYYLGMKNYKPVGYEYSVPLCII